MQAGLAVAGVQQPGKEAGAAADLGNAGGSGEAELRQPGIELAWPPAAECAPIARNVRRLLKNARRADYP